MLNEANHLRISRTFFNIGLRYLLRRPWQSILMVLGITLGVAVVVAIDLANASASRAFSLSTETITGKATHQITGGPEGVAENVYTSMRHSGLEIAAAPTLAAYVTSPELGGLPMQLLGVDPFAEGPFRSYLGGSEPATPIAQTAAFFTRPGAVLLSTGLAERFGLQACTAPGLPGCQITLQISGYTQPAEVVGLLAPTDALSRRALDGLILADIATAQELTGQVGRLSTIDLILPDTPAAVEAVEALLPPETRVQPVAARTGAISQMTEAFQVNLTALSLLALVVGLFLIYNTMTFSVVQRRPLFGTLRCLGVTRREVFALVVSEALAAGLLGAALGVGLGILLGQGAVRMVTQTINDLYFVVTVRGIEIPPSSLIKGAVLGVTATVVAAAFPAWEAASVPARAALSRSGLESKARRAVGWAAAGGVALLGAGALLLLLPQTGLGLSFTGTFVVIFGFALLTPLVTVLFMRGMTPSAGRLWGALGRMAPRDVVNSLSRTSVAVAALMVAVSVTIGVSLMVGSFRYTVETWLAQTLQGDIYVSPAGADLRQTANRLDPQVLATLQSFPGVARVDTLRAVTVDSPAGPVQLAATGNPGIRADRIFASTAGSPEEVDAALQNGAVLVSEPFANRLNLPHQGAEISLETSQGLHTFPVAGVYYDYASSQGTVMMTAATYARFWPGDKALSAAVLRLLPGQDVDAVTRDLQAALTPIQALEVRPNQALREETLVIFDRTFAITSALQLLATAVAFIGVLSALLSLQLEKQRELGVLRAVGLTVRQLWGLVMLETGLMGAAAGLLAMPTGFVLSLILIYVINRRAFGWTLQMQLSPAPFVEAFFVALLAALLAGVYPARKIGQMQVAEAVRGDW